MTESKYKTIEYWRERETRLVAMLDRAVGPTETRLVNEAIEDVRTLIAKRFPSHAEVVRPS